MSVIADVRQAARSCLASPGSAAVLVLTIGVGAGGDAAINAFAGGFSAHVAASLSTADRLEFVRVRMLLFAASGLILLLAAATVAGLRLSHASGRTRETAIKVSLGASRRRLAWQSLLESALVAAAGGGVAAVAHLWTSHLMPILLFAEDAERLTWSPDWTTLASTTLVWVVVIAGIRLALGAEPGHVLTMVMRQGFGLVLIGCATGTVLAAAAAHVLSGFLLGLSTLDLPAFAGAVALCMAVGLAACYGPARRATNADPLSALRSD